MNLKTCAKGTKLRVYTRAIMLVKENEVACIMHNNILETRICIKGRIVGIISPWFDLKPVHTIGKSVVLYVYSSYRVLVWTTTYAPNADSMVAEIMAIQSSPVLIMLCSIWMLRECEIWIPSLLGQFPRDIYINTSHMHIVTSQNTYLFVFAINRFYVWNTPKLDEFQSQGQFISTRC